VVGFKSIICYCTGLSISPHGRRDSTIVSAMERVYPSTIIRLDDRFFFPHFVHITAV
jgi:hypothetical protein